MTQVGARRRNHETIRRSSDQYNTSGKKPLWQGNLFSATSTPIFTASSSFLLLKYVFFPLLFDVEARANGFRNSVTLKEKTPLI